MHTSSIVVVFSVLNRIIRQGHHKQSAESLRLEAQLEALLDFVIVIPDALHDISTAFTWSLKSFGWSQMHMLHSHVLQIIQIKCTTSVFTGGLICDLKNATGHAYIHRAKRKTYEYT